MRTEDSPLYILPGQAAIPADKLRQIVSAEEGEPTLTIEVTGEECHIRSSGAHFRIFGYPATDFPPIPDLAAYIAGGVGTSFTSTSVTSASSPSEPLRIDSVS